ncbi:MAG: tetratricopeptide repeat protein [Vitreoscilla sp.]
MNAPTEPTTTAREVTMTLDEALAHAVQRHQAGYLEQARPIYEAVLERDPDRVDVLNWLGILKHQRGELAEAAALMRRVVLLQPEADGVWNNLGNVLMRLEQMYEAGEAFKRSLELAPSPQAWSNVARVFRKQGDTARSEQACRQALELDPDHGPAMHNLALALISDGRVDEGVAAALRAMQLLPPHEQRRQLYMQLLLYVGETAQAVVILRAWLAQEPDNPYVQHHLAACTGVGTPGRASDAYVEKLFDSFAPTFDGKLSSLHYRAPQVVADAVAAALPSPSRQLDVADIGCGTGLCGPLLRPWALRLVGCDLSGAMLERASQRVAYDELHKAELTAFLRERPGAFDLVVSADTLNYFGELGEVARAVHGALRAGGTFVFTLEALGDGGDATHKLQDNGRYAHDGAHARQVFEAAGLLVQAPVEAVLREEKQAPVRGWLVVARRRT